MKALKEVNLLRIVSILLVINFILISVGIIKGVSPWLDPMAYGPDAATGMFRYALALIIVSAVLNLSAATLLWRNKILGFVLGFGITVMYFADQINSYAGVIFASSQVNSDFISFVNMILKITIFVLLIIVAKNAKIFKKPVFAGGGKKKENR